jgi:hypothetical protein
MPGHDAVQPRQPGGITDIGFATWYVLGAARVNKDDVKAMLFEDFKGRDPVNTGGLHCHACNVTGFEPARHLVQVARERPKGSNRIIVGIGIYGRHVHG